MVKDPSRTYCFTYEDGSVDFGALPLEEDVFKLIDEYNASFKVGIIKVEYMKYSDDLKHKLYTFPIKRVPYIDTSSGLNRILKFDRLKFTEILFWRKERQAHRGESEKM